MAKTQRRSINPPGPTDRETLTDYSSTIQLTFDDIYQAAHSHSVLKSNPKKLDGAVQTISVVDDGINVYLVVKTGRGWYRSVDLTAI